MRTDTSSSTSFILSIGLVLGLHRCIVNVSGLSSGDSLSLSLLVEQPEYDNLDTDKSDESNEDDENSSYTGCVVSRFVLCFE